LRVDFWCSALEQGGAGGDLGLRHPSAGLRLLEAAVAPSQYLAILEIVPSREELVEAMRQVEDPELGMDIVDLGLLYDVEVTGPRVKVLYSLTSMGCPAGPMIEQDIRAVAESIDGVEAVETELTFDPPWTPDRMSEDAKFILGIG
jgi:metal-sulfur cluster biosynthetic enzyme